MDGMAYSLASDGALNVAPTTSFFVSGTGLAHSASNVVNFTTSTTAFTITGAITPTTTNNWVVTSDASIKKDVVDYGMGLTALKSLRPVSYKFNGMYGTQDDGKTQVGLIAQEVQQTPMSSMVKPLKYSNPKTSESADLLGLETNPRGFALITAGKELDTRVKALEPKVA
jgi:hypothetical protein